MTKYLSLKIPSSCHENWNGMTPEQGGQYCFSCQKPVIDFTQMTDRELIQYFKLHKGSTCGRFTADQLNRNIPFAKKPLPWIKYLFTFSIPAFLLSLKASAQSKKIIASTEVSPIEAKNPAVEDSLKKPLSLAGVVSDEAGNPLVSASVLVKGTNRGALTDALGRFEINEVNVSTTLVISYVGYSSKEVKVTSLNPEVKIRLTLSSAVMGEVVVVNYGVRRKKMVEKMEKEKKQELTAEPSSTFAYPNPVMTGGQLNVRGRYLESGIYKAEFYTLGGQLLHVMKITYSKKNGDMRMQVPDLLSGTYILHLTHEKSGKHFSQQIIVQN